MRFKNPKFHVVFLFFLQIYLKLAIIYYSLQNCSRFQKHNDKRYLKRQKNIDLREISKLELLSGEHFWFRCIVSRLPSNRSEGKYYLGLTLQVFQCLSCLFLSIRHSFFSSVTCSYCRTQNSNIVYGNIIYDQPQNESFGENLESVLYKVVLAIIGAIQGTSRDKMY